MAKVIPWCWRTDWLVCFALSFNLIHEGTTLIPFCVQEIFVWTIFVLSKQLINPFVSKTVHSIVHLFFPCVTVRNLVHVVKWKLITRESLIVCPPVFKFYGRFPLCLLCPPVWSLTTKRFYYGNPRFIAGQHHILCGYGIPFNL